MEKKNVLKRKIEKIFYLLSQDLWLLNLAGCFFWRGVSESKHLSRQQLLVFFCFCFYKKNASAQFFASVINTKYIQPPNIVWYKPFKQKVVEL